MKKIILILVALGLVGLAGIRLMENRSRIVAQTEDFTTDFVTVSVANVEKRAASFTLNLTGTLYPIRELDIAAETSGKIVSLNFELGQYFLKGGTIATIDDQIKQLTYESAKITADRIKKDYVRAENLYKSRVSSEQEYDLARTSYETAKNNLAEATKQLSYTIITAPIDGTITKKIVEEGTYVRAGDAVVSIVDVSRLKVKVMVSESDVYHIHANDAVKITTDIYPGKTFEGKISFVSPRGDTTHNYPVEIEIANSMKNPLKAGTFVNVEVDINSDNTGLFIPRNSLLGSIMDAKVYVAADGKALMKNVVIGRGGNESLEVLSGLTENELVVVSGQVNLTDNKPIKIINTD